MPRAGTASLGRERGGNADFAENNKRAATPFSKCRYRSFFSVWSEALEDSIQARRSAREQCARLQISLARAPASASSACRLIATRSTDKAEAPQCRHAEHCGASFAGGIRSIDSAPRRTWPDRLPLPLSYGHDSGALVRRANQLCPATSQLSRPVPNTCRAVFGWRPTEDRHARVLTELPNASPMCGARQSSSIENVSRRQRGDAWRVTRGAQENERPVRNSGTGLSRVTQHASRATHCDPCTPASSDCSSPSAMA